MYASGDKEDDVWSNGERRIVDVPAAAVAAAATAAAAKPSLVTTSLDSLFFFFDFFSLFPPKKPKMLAGRGGPHQHCVTYSPSIISPFFLYH